MRAAALQREIDLLLIVGSGRAPQHAPRIEQGGELHCAVQPPSIERLAPVICAAASEQRYTASEATCSTVTNSLVGCAARSTSCLTCSSVNPRAFMVSGICFSTSGVHT